MSQTKEAQRAELHKTIWRIANDLRGSVDGWDFKTYVLGILFYRFISENLSSYLNKLEREAGDSDFDYTMLSDRTLSSVARTRSTKRLLHPSQPDV
jgi:type I restriction enzyme M protein